MNENSRLSIRRCANGGFIVWEEAHERGVASDIVFAGSSIDEALTFIRNTLEPPKVDAQKKAFNEYPLPPGLNVSPEQQAALNEKARHATFGGNPKTRTEKDSGLKIETAFDGGFFVIDEFDQHILSAHSTRALAAAYCREKHIERVAKIEKDVQEKMRAKKADCSEPYFGDESIDPSIMRIGY